jgi:hypothetical protein
MEKYWTRTLTRRDALQLIIEVCDNLKERERVYKVNSFSINVTLLDLSASTLTEGHDVTKIRVGSDNGGSNPRFIAFLNAIFIGVLIGHLNDPHFAFSFQFDPKGYSGSGGDDVAVIFLLESLHKNVHMK